MIGDNRFVGNKENAEVEQWWNRNNGLGEIKKPRERSNGGGTRIERGHIVRDVKVGQCWGQMENAFSTR